MISKELLSEVLCEDIKFNDFDSFCPIILIENELEISYCYPYYDNYTSDGMYDTSMKKTTGYINIHELAYKCKEWAVKHNFHLISWTISYEAVKRKGYCQTHNTQDADKESDKPFHADTEPESIFKACQWILDNKDKQ